MTAQNRTTLKTYFATGDKPTSAQFGNLIDSFLSLTDTGSQSVASDIILGGGISVSGKTVLGNMSAATVSAATIYPSNILGTTTNNDAISGAYGEYVESEIAVGSAVSLTNNIIKNMTSISLTAGDWDISMNMLFTGGTTTTIQYLSGSISSTTAALDKSKGRFSSIYGAGAAIFNIINPIGINIPPTRFSLASPTTIYAVSEAGFGVSTCASYGILRARRIR